MASFKVEDQAWELLFDEPLEFYKIYGAIRRKMNYDTCIAGAQKGLKISEQYLRESISYSARPGRKASKKISRSKIRWIIENLEGLGLIEDKGNFVFLCKLAVQEKSIQKINSQGTAKATTIETTIETTISTTKKNQAKLSPSKDLTKEEQPDLQPDLQPEVRQEAASRYSPHPVTGINNINNLSDMYIKTPLIELGKKNTQISIDQIQNYFLEQTGWKLHTVCNPMANSIFFQWIALGATMTDVEMCYGKTVESKGSNMPTSINYYDKVMITILANKEANHGQNQAVSKRSNLSANARRHGVSKAISEYINGLPESGESDI